MTKKHIIHIDPSEVEGDLHLLLFPILVDYLLEEGVDPSNIKVASPDMRILALAKDKYSIPNLYQSLQPRQNEGIRWDWTNVFYPKGLVAQLEQLDNCGVTSLSYYWDEKEQKKKVGITYPLIWNGKVDKCIFIPPIPHFISTLEDFPPYLSVMIDTYRQIDCNQLLIPDEWERVLEVKEGRTLSYCVKKQKSSLS